MRTLLLRFYSAISDPARNGSRVCYIVVSISIFIYKQLCLLRNVVFINKVDFDIIPGLHVVESLVLVVPIRGTMQAASRTVSLSVRLSVCAPVKE